MSVSVLKGPPKMASLFLATNQALLGAEKEDQFTLNNNREELEHKLGKLGAAHPPSHLPFMLRRWASPIEPIF